MSDVARRILVRGRVQGVNYRAWLRDRARARGVRGYAANLADGAVEVWLEGEAEAVAELERAAAQGPPHGTVEEVQAETVEPAGHADFGRR